MLSPEKGIYFDSPEQAEAVAIHFLRDYVRLITIKLRAEAIARNSQIIARLREINLTNIEQCTKGKLQILCNFPNSERWAIQTEMNETMDFQPYFRTLYGNIGANHVIKADVFICLAGNQPAHYEIEEYNHNPQKKLIPFKISDFLKDPTTATPYLIELLQLKDIDALKARDRIAKATSAAAQFNYPPLDQDGEETFFG